MTAGSGAQGSKAFGIVIELIVPKWDGHASVYRLQFMHTAMRIWSGYGGTRVAVPSALQARISSLRASAKREASFCSGTVSPIDKRSSLVGSPSLLPCMGPMPNHVSANCGTWRVQPEGMSQMFRLLYLGNGWADCVEIWHALGDPLVTAYAIVTGGVSLHVRTCRDTPTPRFCISETAWPIVFKFGMWVGGH